MARRRCTHAAYANNLELTRMLLRAGANANAVNRYGVGPLRLAVEAGNAAVVEALLKAGANANATLPKGESVLMTAARTGDPATVRQLARWRAPRSTSPRRRRARRR